MVPTASSPTLVPSAWAASSTTRSSGSEAARASSATLVASPPRWTTTIADTPPTSSTTLEIVAGEGIPVHGSTSASTGWSPACTIAVAAPQNVMVDITTLEPRSRRSARNDSSSAAVHELTATARRAPTYRANSCSNSTTCGPEVTQPDASTWSAAARASGQMYARVNGTG